MKITCVHIHIKKERIEDFKAATMKNHLGTRQEPRNYRFDVLQEIDDPSHFVLYEVFADEEALAAHRNTSHYFAWRDTVTEWMEKPRVAVGYNALAPLDPSEW